MLKKVILIVTTVFLVPHSLWADKPAVKDDTYRVSLVNVIAEPKRFVGYNISVVGFLGDSGDVLFLTKDHADAYDIATAVYISVAYRESDISAHGVPSTGCESKIVRIFGKFYKSSSGEFLVRSVYKIQTFGHGGDLKLVGDCWVNPAASPADRNSE